MLSELTDHERQALASFIAFVEQIAAYIKARLISQHDVHPIVLDVALEYTAQVEEEVLKSAQERPRR